MTFSTLLAPIIPGVTAALLAVAPVAGAQPQQPACTTQHGAADGTPCLQDGPDDGPATPGLITGPPGSGADQPNCVPGRVCNNTHS
jgi:hypothetical protein